MARWSPDKAAANGAAWLDEHRPSWFKRISLRRLDMSSSSACILGQCYGGYLSALGQLVGFDSNGARAHRWAVASGFQAPRVHYVDNTGNYERLGLAWRDLIMERRAAHRSRGRR